MAKLRKKTEIPKKTRIFFGFLSVIVTSKHGLKGNHSSERTKSIHHFSFEFAHRSYNIAHIMIAAFFVEPARKVHIKLHPIAEWCAVYSSCSLSSSISGNSIICSNGAELPYMNSL